MNYSFGLSWIGLVIFIIAMIPNILFVVLPPKVKPENRKDGGIVLNILEHGSQAVYVMLVVCMVSDKRITVMNPFTISMLVMMILYYLLWLRYFTGGRDYALLGKSLWCIPMPMAIFPVLYFLLAALWLGNLPAFLAMVVFGAAHMTNSYITFR